MRPRPLLALGLGALLLSATFAGRGSQETVLDPDMHHLGDDPTPEWTEAPELPEGSSLEFSFEGRANAREWTLVFTQRNINDRWAVELNGTEVHVLAPGDALVEVFQPLPAGTLVDGTNRFRLTTNQPADDITFGRVRLIEAPFREVLDLRAVRVNVRDGGSGKALPARVTVTDHSGVRVPVYYADGEQQAAREGVVYTSGGVAAFEVPAGEYRVHATRGSEWSLASADLTLFGPRGDGTSQGLLMVLEREVDTTGYVACDTHIHTLTFSGHGDSSVEERMVTLAGEGVELAISTDHNHNTDYRPYQERMGLGEYFTTVVGNEVTTPIGHFNGFPLDPADEVPPYELRDALQVVDGMRAKGAQVVILNHPRWPSHEEGPFGVIELNHYTGASSGSPYESYPFDAMELVNSTTEEPEPMLLFEDWFALLNRGERVFAVGSSDSHTVGDPVGGGRTYVPSATDDPAKIDVDAACEAIANGRTSVAMGIFVTASASVEGEDRSYVMGDLVSPGDRQVSLSAEYRAPSWIHARKATLFVNGEAYGRVDGAGAAAWKDGAQRHQAKAESSSFKSSGATFSLSSKEFHQDAWCVWVITGEGVEGAFWPLHNDYTLGATNPIFLDMDGDGQYSSPRETAHRMVDEVGLDMPQLRERLARSHEAVVFHALERVRERMHERARRDLEQLGLGAGSEAEELRSFLDTLED